MIRRSRIISLFIITISCLFIVIPERHSVAQSVMGARAVAMGQAGTALPNDNWSVFNNPALLQSEAAQFSFYGFRYAGIAEITDLASSGSFQSSIGTIGVGIHRYGFNLFSENQFRIAYKNRFDLFHAGVSLSYIHILQSKDFGNSGTVGVDVGFAMEITPALWLSAKSTNVNSPVYSDSDEKLARQSAAGFSFMPAERSVITAEMVKDVEFPASFRTGLEVELLPEFYTRAGITTRPSTYSFGFGYNTARWSANFALQQHNPLGLSPALDISIQI